MVEAKEKRWCVSLPPSCREDAVKLAAIYGDEFPVSLGNAVAKALREELKRKGVKRGE